MRIEFVVDGAPKGKDRPRLGPNGIVYTPDATIAEEKRIAKEARRLMVGQPLATGPIALFIDAVFETPASWPKAVREAARRGEVYHVSKPDKDNIEKLAMDALSGVVWADDCQVADGRTRKRFGAVARLEILVVGLAGVAAPNVDPTNSPKTPATRRLEARAAVGEIQPGKRRPRRKGGSRACKEHAIGRRLR